MWLFNTGMEVVREIRRLARFELTPRTVSSFIIVATVVYPIFMTPPTFCPFRLTVNMPCPFCGMTAALNSLLSLNIQEALLLHPLVIIPIFYLIRALATDRFWHQSPALKYEKAVILSAFIGVWIFRLST